ncbi:MAG TPA: hypothetical protein PLR52_00355 [Bacteroidales bacterium]|nr:hypothetical protein [Bacteroidales bacterium]HPR73051.1 hypothetical protein [Bacteroidales bacterium]
MTHSPSYRRILHRMGYYDYQQGLIVNYMNQGEGWLNHQKKCRDFILNAIDFFLPEKITVLGSGWLLELPLIEMSEKTDEIILVDIIHPPEVIEQTAGIKNLKLLEDDITGGLVEEVWKWAGKGIFLNRKSFPEMINIPNYNLEDPGLVISLNVLTQLETLPLRILEKKAVQDKEKIYSFRKKIQDKHISFLKKHKSVLISDTNEIFMDSAGGTTEERTMLTRLPECISKETWMWDLDLKGSNFNRKKSVMEVSAVIFDYNG